MNKNLSEADTEAVYYILIEQLGVAREQLTPEARLTGDLHADSLTVIQIVMALEEKFQIEIPESEGENAETVEAVFDAVARTLARREEAAGLRPTQAKQ